MLLNTEELQKLIKNYDFRSFLESGKGRLETFNGILFTYLEGYGGEGKGEDWWVVFSVEKDMQQEFFKFSAYYSSYDGVNMSYGNFYKVKPVQKVITVWESI